MLLVTGCALSGTGYISAVLSSIGMDCPHEVAIGADGIVAWNAVFESEYCGGPAIKHGVFDKIIHQVRNPLAAIASITTLSPDSRVFIARYIDIDPSAPVLLRAMQYWYKWNTHAEKLASYTYKVEHLLPEFDVFLRAIGKEADVGCAAKLPHNINSRPHNLISWDDMSAYPKLMNDVKQKAEQYGYQLGA